MGGDFRPACAGQIDHDQYPNRVAADTGRCRRFAQLHQGCPVLGVTQPAVSAQIKRLQGLFGADLLDKSAPGVSLTSAGELVVNYARRLLSINDQILDIAGPRLAAKTIRIGTTGDFTAAGAALGLKCARAQPARSAFRALQRQASTMLLRDLREGETDLAIWASTTGPTLDTRHYWTEPLVWVRAPSTRGRSAAGAAGVLWRGMPVRPRQHERAEQGRPRTTRRSFVGSNLHRAGRCGGRGLRRDGAAAQPRRSAGHRDLGERAAAEAAGYLLRHLCARRRRRRRARATRRRDRGGAQPASRRPAASPQGQQHSAA